MMKQLLNSSHGGGRYSGLDNDTLSILREKFKKDMKARVSMIPLKRKGSPKDIAKMAYYLGSEENDFITNEIFTISGGE